MPERGDIDRLLDILEEQELLESAILGKTFEEFDGDAVLQRAVLHMLQTIGEAANYLSEDRSFRPAHRD